MSLNWNRFHSGAKRKFPPLNKQGNPPGQNVWQLLIGHAINWAKTCFRYSLCLFFSKDYTHMLSLSPLRIFHYTCHFTYTKPWWNYISRWGKGRILLSLVLLAGWIINSTERDWQEKIKFNFVGIGTPHMWEVERQKENMGAKDILS